MSCSQIFLGLGSNTERESHLSLRLAMLAEHLQGIRCSPVYESASATGLGSAFLNMVVAAETKLSLDEMLEWLKEIEAIHGRRLNSKAGRVTLDIDLLVYDDLVGTFNGVELPRPEILHRSYLLYPLSLLAPEGLHPGVNISYLALWENTPIEPQLTLSGPAPEVWRTKNR